MTWRRTPLPPGWGRIRLDVLKRDPICMWGVMPEDIPDGWPDEPGQMPQCADDSTEVDHMGAPNDHRMVMLRGLCHFHHAKRSHSQAVAASARIRAERSRIRPVEPHPAFRKDCDG